VHLLVFVREVQRTTILSFLRSKGSLQTCRLCPEAFTATKRNGISRWQLRQVTKINRRFGKHYFSIIMVLIGPDTHANRSGADKQSDRSRVLCWTNKHNRVLSVCSQIGFGRYVQGCDISTVTVWFAIGKPLHKISVRLYTHHVRENLGTISKCRLQSDSSFPKDYPIAKFHFFLYVCDTIT
jgi:hypothetical protein